MTSGHRSRSTTPRYLRYDARKRPNSPSPSSPRCASRINQVEKTGTRLLDSRYDAIIAKPTASDSGTNNCRATPAMKNEGTNTASMHTIERKLAIALRLHASTTATPRDEPG